MDTIDALARAVIERCKARGLRIATAESCTGGLVAGALTEVSGSSAVVDRGFVTYSNEAKTELLGVPASLIVQHGAVSEPVARTMAEGARTRARVELSVGITGIAGPTGGSAEKPVGLVHFAVSTRERTVTEHRQFPGDRRAVREASVKRALELLFAAAERA